MFHDDVHYIDGLLHLDEYSVMIDQLNMLPPSPEYPLDEDVLARRFDAEPWLLTWLGLQQDGPYWLRTSLRTDYSRLHDPRVPDHRVVGRYRDSVFRHDAERPRTGPRADRPVEPHLAARGGTGPAVEWRAHAVRWWEHWLKGIDAGLPEPMADVYVQTWRPPDPDLTELPGYWRSEDALPPARTRPPGAVLRARPPAVARPPGPQESAQLKYVPSAGVEAGHWWGELTVDQRGADACSLTFDSARRSRRTWKFSGSAGSTIHGRADASPLNWFARLSDVASDGTTTLVAGGAQIRARSAA